MATPVSTRGHRGTVVHPDVGDAGHGVHQGDPTRRGLFEEVGDLPGPKKWDFSGVFEGHELMDMYRYVEMCRKYTYIYILYYIILYYIILYYIILYYIILYYIIYIYIICIYIYNMYIYIHVYIYISYVYVYIYIYCVCIVCNKMYHVPNFFGVVNQLS